MNRDELFLETLDEIDHRLQLNQSAYNLLMVSGLLRKLLLDDNPLVDQVNRSRRLRIRYHAYPMEPLAEMAARGLVLDGVEFVGIFDAFNPDIGEETPER